MRGLFDHILLLSGYKFASFLLELPRLYGLAQPALRLPDVNSLDVPQKNSLADFYEPSEELFYGGSNIRLHGAEPCLLRIFIVL